MRPLERYWFGDVALARPYLLVRFVLVLLAFDTWLNLIPEGAKYGVGSFNVAHFAWFDDFVPSPGFYLGVLAFTGVLALSQALYRPHPIAIVAIACIYTLGWSCRASRTGCRCSAASATSSRPCRTAWPSEPWGRSLPSWVPRRSRYTSLRPGRAGFRST